MITKIFNLVPKAGVTLTPEQERFRREAELELHIKFHQAHRDKLIFEIVQKVASGNMTEETARKRIAKLMESDK